MIIIMSLFYVVSTCIILLELLAIPYFGRYMLDEEIYEHLVSEKENGSKINTLNNDIIYIGEMNYIAKTRFLLFSRYYISGHGRIPIWSKSHKLIKNEFKKLTNG